MNSIGYQPYYPQQPAFGGFQLNLGTPAAPPPAVNTDDVLNLLTSRNASAVAVASSMWNHGGASVGARYASYGSNGFFSYGIGAALKSSLVVGAIFSAINNGVRLARGEENLGIAAANFTGDMVATTVGSLAGTAAAGVGAAILGGFMAPGILLTLATAACGLGGVWLADSVLRQTQFFQNLQVKTWSLFS